MVENKLPQAVLGVMADYVNFASGLQLEIPVIRGKPLVKNFFHKDGIIPEYKTLGGLLALVAFIAKNGNFKRPFHGIMLFAAGVLEQFTLLCGPALFHGIIKFLPWL
jgi:hypothetical protein